jgi:AcrR family transcriptional regulator
VIATAVIATARRAGTRAAPMPPEQRRATIIAAALPLLRIHGADVTTKQIAEAAGIAEGTLFRAFPDKESLVLAVVQQVFDPLPTIAHLRAVDLSLPLRGRLKAAVDIVAGRLGIVWELMSALRMMGPPDQDPRYRSAITAHQLNDAMPDALMALIEPDRDELRVDPAKAARLLRQITFACTHPRITNENPLDADEIVDLLLDGLRAHAP